MRRKSKGYLWPGLFSILTGALVVSNAVAQTITVTPVNPTVAVDDTLQFTATGNLTPTVVSASGSHSCALLPDGTIRCWGYNEYGQLGNGSTVDFPTPVEVLGIADAIAISAGHHHTCALLADGSVRCWGRNEFGELGDGTICTDPPCATPVPVAVHGLTTATAVTAGAYHTCALLANGDVRCWGYNEFGQLGNGTTTSFSAPVTVIGLAAPARVTAGAYHTCALMPDGAVQCWGRNDAGQLGDGDTPDSSTPVAVSGLTGASSVSAGGFHNCARLPDGTLQCWGLNSFGQLGDGSLTYASGNLLPSASYSRTPVDVAGISTAAVVAAGGYHTCASLADGSTHCWGQNDFGQLGNGTTASSSTPVEVPDLAAGAVVSTAAWHTCALLPDESVQCWGYNEFGQLGHGAAGDSSTPVSVIGTGPVTWTSSDTAVATIGTDTGLATALAPGSTTITATANSAHGTTILTVERDNTAPDTTAPTVAITSPGEGATVSGAATVAASASDDGGVAGVQFFVDAAAVGDEDTAAPYEVAWDTTTVADGSHTLTAVARDTAGNIATSAPVSVTVSNGGAQAVVWTDGVNVTVTGNSIEKTGGCDTCSDAGAVSTQQITSGDGYVEFTIPLTTKQAFAGLSTGNLDTSRLDIDFALKFVAGGVVEVRENDLYRVQTTFAANDVFRVAVVGGRVEYSKNGIVFYTSAKPPAYPLLLDTSLQDLNVRIENALIFGSL